MVCVSTSSLSSFVIDGFDTLPPSMCGVRLRHRCHRILWSGVRPCRYYYSREERSHRLSPHLARFREQCEIWVITSSLSSFVIDGFDTLPRSMRGLSSHVIVVIAWYCPVASPVATTIAEDNVHTDCPRTGPVIARDVWSVLPRHRYRRLSWTCSTPCRARAQSVVCVSTSSLRSLIIDGFDSLTRSRAMCGLC